MPGSQADSLMTGGIALATIGGVLMGVRAVEATGPDLSVWHNSWFIGGSLFVALGIVLTIAGVILRLRRRQAASPVPPEAGPGYREALSDGKAAPLSVRLTGREKWLLVGDTKWVFAVEGFAVNVSDQAVSLIEITARTADHDRRGPVADAVLAGVKEQKTRLAATLGAELFDGPVEIAKGSSITTWLIASAYAPIPEGGRPACTVTFRDSLDNRYPRVIAARPAGTY
jgi:hypothetical protein